MADTRAVRVGGVVTSRNQNSSVLPSPDDFSLPDAYVQNGILAPQQQAFKALIVRGNDSLTATGVSKLAVWAKQGLPIIFSGGVPTAVSGTVSASTQQVMNSTLAQLSKLSN